MKPCVVLALALAGCGAAASSARPSSVMVRACNDTGHNLLDLAFHGFTEGSADIRATQDP